MKAKGKSEYLTTTEAAKLVGCTPDWIRQCCLAGRFPGARRFGRDWAIPRAEVEAFAAEARPRGNPNWQKAPADGG